MRHRWPVQSSEQSGEGVLEASALQPALDAEAFEVLRALAGEDDPEFLMDLIDQYLSDATARIDGLVEAARQGDVDGLCGTAHALKSASANMGGRILAGMCQEIEAQARSGEVPDAVQQVERIVSEFERVNAALSEERNKLDP